MTRVRVAAVAAALVAAGAALPAHDLFLRPRGFFLAPNATVTIPVFNGSFTRSENAIEGIRLEDLSLWGPAGRRQVLRSTYTDRDPQSTVRLRVGGPGSYVVGLSVAPRTTTLDGPAFDKYLADERITSIIERRKANRTLGRPASESYAKAAKTLLAVTDAAGHVVMPQAAGTRPVRSPAVQAFGYPAEIVAVSDPNTLGVGALLPVRCFVGGEPLTGWTVLAGGTIGTSDTPIPLQELRTDETGRVTVRLTHDGHWFIKFVHMREGTAAEGVDYVSRWATLTFGLMPANPSAH